MQVFYYLYCYGAGKEMEKMKEELQQVVNEINQMEEISLEQEIDAKLIIRFIDCLELNLKRFSLRFQLN